MDAWGIAGIQQVGLGTRDLPGTFGWARRSLGFDVPVFSDEGEAGLMLRYTGGAPCTRRALLAVNLAGGGGLEVWQHTGRSPLAPTFQPRLGDLGIFSVRLKTRNVSAAYAALGARALETVGGIGRSPSGDPHFFLRGPEGVIFEVVPAEDWFGRGRAATGGVCGCTIGVADIEGARALYSGVLGYDTVVRDDTGRFDDFAGLPGGDGELRRVLLAHRQPRKGAFAILLGATRLELVQALDRAPRRIFEGRFWGDPGFIHLCFDAWGMDALAERCRAQGFPFTVDSAAGFRMGEAAGRFSYVEDPGGTLVEFVETRRVPIAERWGISLDLSRRDPRRPLPGWMLRALALKRVKD